LLLGGCTGGASEERSASRGASEVRNPTLRPSTSTEPTLKRSADDEDEVFRIVAAGDIACVPGRPATAGECQMEATAALVEALDPDVVLPLGDLQYERGKAADFDASYDRSWGRFKDRTRPVVGNHEYSGGRAAGYDAYFGAAAHGPGGWYSFDGGGWHVVVLNSVCAPAGGCGQGSRQYDWLRRDLEATTSECILAAWHHPRWSSGLHGDDPSMEPAWQALAARGADVVVSGHDHHYERFEPRDGIVQYVVGTGGRSLYPVLGRESGSAAMQSRGFGVLEIELRPDAYRTTFHPVPGFDYTETVTRACR
jgi:3',5'-cyclic AMP phosphodiesterase CpdA